MGYRMVTGPMMSCDPKGAVRQYGYGRLSQRQLGFSFESISMQYCQRATCLFAKVFGRLLNRARIDNIVLIIVWRINWFATRRWLLRIGFHELAVRRCFTPIIVHPDALSDNHGRRQRERQGQLLPVPSTLPSAASHMSTQWRTDYRGGYGVRTPIDVANFFVF